MEKRKINLNGFFGVEIMGRDDCLLNGGWEERGSVNVILKFRV